MDLWWYAHALHRFWRFRLRSERREIAFLFSLALRNRTAVDVGAHRAGYAYWMHPQTGPAGCVVGFEPQPELAAELRALRRAFGLQRLHIEEAALSDVAGEATLLRPDKHWGGASLLEPSRADAGAACTAFSVRCLRLDDYLAEHRLPPVGLVKIDVEGHEARVVRGALAMLREDRPALILESSDAVGEDSGLWDELEALGYEGTAVDRRGVELFRRDAAASARATHLRNYLFQSKPGRRSTRRALVGAA